MPEIFLIGRSLKGFSETLSSGGYGTSECASIKSALRKIDKADIIILDKEQQYFLRELIKASRDVPKLIVFSGSLPASFNSLLKEPLSYPLREPSGRELLFYAERMLKEKFLLNENRALAKTVTLLKKEIEFFGEINRMMTTSRDLSEMLAVIMKRAKELIGVEAWSIMLLDEQGDLVLEKTDGKVKKKLKKLRLKPGEGIAGWVLQNGVPVVVPDVSTDKRFSPRLDRYARFATKSVMAAPIKTENRIVGVLEVINKTDGVRFTGEDFNILMRLVDQAALVTDRMTLYQKLEELVVTDDLTNLFNTRYLNRSIETEVLRSNRYHTSVAMIFMDVDFFKNVNDTYGHLVGSKLLVEVGQLLINQLRGLDIVARYGGDEFVIVLPQTSPDNAVRIAERIRRAVEKNTFLKSEGLNIKITSSFGVASYPESAKTKDDLLRLADEAMYKVKHRTRNGVYAII